MTPLSKCSLWFLRADYKGASLDLNILGAVSLVKGNEPLALPILIRECVEKTCGRGGFVLRELPNSYRPGWGTLEEYY